MKADFSEVPAGWEGGSWAPGALAQEAGWRSTETVRERALPHQPAENPGRAAPRFQPADHLQTYDAQLQQVELALNTGLDRS